MSTLEHTTEKEMFEYLLHEYMSISSTSTFEEIKDRDMGFGICYKISCSYGDTIHYDTLIERLKKHIRIEYSYCKHIIGYFLESTVHKHFPTLDLDKEIGRECYKICIEPRIKLLSHIVNTL